MLISFPIMRLRVQLPKDGILPLQQGLRRVQLQDGAFVQHHDPVRGQDGVDAVGDGEHGGVLQLFPYDLLQHRVAVVVDAGGGLVDEHDLLGVKEGPRDVDQLLLARAEIAASLLDNGVESVPRLYALGKPAELEHLENPFLRKLVQRVDVLHKGRRTSRTVPVKRKWSWRMMLKPTRTVWMSRE